MHRHRELCEHAVDPLEIAAALETDGVTDRVAARFRHRDVFSLAEELFARAPRAEDRPCGAPTAVATPGAVAGPPRVAGPARVAMPAGPASPAESASPEAGPASPGVLLPLLAVLPGVLAVAAMAVFTSAATGPRYGSGAVKAAAAVTAVGLVCALAAAVWCARWFAVRAGRRLQRSRGLDEFGAGARSLLTAAVLMFAGTLTVLHLALRGGLALAGVRGGGGGGPYGSLIGGSLAGGWRPGGSSSGGSLTVGVTAPGAALPVVVLGLLLFVALLLAAHGFGRVAAVGLVAACALQACAACVAWAECAARVPCAVAPAAQVPYAAVSVAAYGLAALWLLACAYRLLGRASSHRPRTVAAKAKPPCAQAARGTRGPRGPRACGEHGVHREHGDHETYEGRGPYERREPCGSCGGPPGPAL